MWTFSVELGPGKDIANNFFDDKGKDKIMDQESGFQEH